ncbi:MAG: hypothetical protein ABIL11_12925 [Chloroflexota bacterium]
MSRQARQLLRSAHRDTVRPQDRFADAANTGTTNATLGTPVRDGNE